jgi:hypothetical protein
MANLKLLGTVSGYTELAASENPTPTRFVLPPSDGLAGQVLATNGAGRLQFVTASTGGSSSYTLPVATTSVLGGVRVDGTTITASGAGIISAAQYTLPTATSTLLGGVRVGAGLSISNGVLSVSQTSSGPAEQADTLKVGSVYRSASVDTPDTGTPNTVAVRDGEGNLNATLFQGTATSAQFADLAEKYIADQAYEPGTVLEFGGQFEVTMAADETRAVAGIVSTAPGFIMNNGLEAVVTDGERTVTLALTGRVPCKVRGTIYKGDLLVSAGGGFARRTNDPKIGTILGKALEDFNDVEGIIEVAVGRY